jgi:hypothetical protein
MDFRRQLNTRLVFMAFFWGPNFSKTRKYHQTPYKNTHLSEVQPLLLAITVSLSPEKLRLKPLYLAISLSLTIRKVNFRFYRSKMETSKSISHSMSNIYVAYITYREKCSSVFLCMHTYVSCHFERQRGTTGLHVFFPTEPQPSTPDVNARRRSAEGGARRITPGVLWCRVLHVLLSRPLQSLRRRELMEAERGFRCSRAYTNVCVCSM